MLVFFINDVKVPFRAIQVFDSYDWYASGIKIDRGVQFIRVKRK